MSDEPTLGEVMRQVQALVRTVESLVHEVRSDYVRKEVYDAKYGAAMQRVEDLERNEEAREKAQADTRRQFFIALAVPIILGVGALLLAVNNFVATGGVP